MHIAMEPLDLVVIDARLLVIRLDFPGQSEEGGAHRLIGFGRLYRGGTFEQLAETVCQHDRHLHALLAHPSPVGSSRTSHSEA